MRARVRPEGVGDFCHRWYEEGTGRYTSIDPDRPLPPPLHYFAYVYAGSNPARFIDPLGLSITWVDPSLEHEFNCLFKAKGFVQPFIHYLVNDSDSWAIQTWDEAPGSTPCKRNNSPSCWTPGHFYVKPNQPNCGSVQGLIHEMIEAHAVGASGMSTFDFPDPMTVELMTSRAPTTISSSRSAALVRSPDVL